MSNPYQPGDQVGPDIRAGVQDENGNWTYDEDRNPELRARKGLPPLDSDGGEEEKPGFFGSLFGGKKRGGAPGGRGGQSRQGGGWGRGGGFGR